MEQLFENLHERKQLLKQANQAVLNVTDDLSSHGDRRISDAQKKFKKTAIGFMKDISDPTQYDDSWDWLVSNIRGRTF